MNKIDTVLFDFDGTVMDTNNVILMSWQHTFRTLRGREEDREVIVKTFGEPLELTMKKESTILYSALTAIEIAMGYDIVSTSGSTFFSFIKS